MPTPAPLLHAWADGPAGERRAESTACSANIPIAELCGVVHNRSDIERAYGFGPEREVCNIRLLVATRGKADLTRTSQFGSD